MTASIKSLDSHHRGDNKKQKNCKSPPDNCCNAILNTNANTQMWILRIRHTGPLYLCRPLCLSLLYCPLRYSVSVPLLSTKATLSTLWFEFFFSFSLSLSLSLFLCTYVHISPRACVCVGSFESNRTNNLHLAFCEDKGRFNSTVPTKPFEIFPPLFLILFFFWFLNFVIFFFIRLSSLYTSPPPLAASPPPRPLWFFFVFCGDVCTRHFSWYQKASRNWGKRCEGDKAEKATGCALKSLKPPHCVLCNWVLRLFNAFKCVHKTRAHTHTHTHTHAARDT